MRECEVCGASTDVIRKTEDKFSLSLLGYRFGLDNIEREICLECFQKETSVGTYTTIEGIDGSGKSTLVDAMNEQPDAEHCTTMEPTEYPSGRAVRESFEFGSDWQTFYAFLSDRAFHVNQVVEPWIESGTNVLSDRGPDSTRVYQRDAIPREVIEFALSRFRTPDQTYILDVPVDTALDRIGAREKETEVFEQADKLERYRERYLELAVGNDRIEVLDGRLPVNELVKEVQLDKQ